jgi:hypothetical protein
VEDVRQLPTESPSPDHGAAAQGRPMRLAVFARRLLHGWPIRCLVLAAVCIVLRMTVLESLAKESSRAVAAAIEESGNFYSKDGVPPMVGLVGSMKPHSWLWLHLHMDSYESTWAFGVGAGSVAIDGETVEQFLGTVYSGAAHAWMDSGAPQNDLSHAVWVLNHGLHHQRRLRELALWGGGLEVLAILLTSAGIMVAWRGSRTMAVERVA